MITSQTTEVKGLGDEKPQAATAYLASEVRAGDVVAPITRLQSSPPPNPKA